MKRILLASTSPHRAALLRRLGLPFETASPNFDESDTGGHAPPDVALAFAEGKARSLAHVGLTREALVVGADQVCALDGELLRKAESPDEAAGQLARLAGRTHTLYTGVYVLDPETGRGAAEIVSVHLTMRPLTDAQIRRYVELDSPRGTCGGYLFEGHGALLFERIESSSGVDDSAIVGLPLLTLVGLLGRFGLDPLG
jgi:septum formation protein